MTPVMTKINKMLIRFGYDKTTRLGFFVFLGYTSLVGRGDEKQDDLVKRLNLFPHCDINAEYRELLEKIDFDRAHKIYDELVWRLDTDLKVRNISNIEGIELHEFNFNNHKILLDDENRIKKLGDSEYFYVEAMRQLGLIMEDADYDAVKAFKSGMCLTNVRLQYDVDAGRWSMKHLRQALPLILYAADFLANDPDAYGEGYLATQIPLQVLLSGTPSQFGQVCWYYQSWVLYKDQSPIPGIETMPLPDFMNWCFDRGKAFLQAFPDKILEAAAAYSNTAIFPIFRSDVDERPLIVAAINEHYGDFDDSHPSSEHIIRALIMFGYFCSLCETTVNQAGTRSIQ